MWVILIGSILYGRRSVVQDFDGLCTEGTDRRCLFSSHCRKVQVEDKLPFSLLTSNR